MNYEESIYEGISSSIPEYLREKRNLIKNAVCFDCEYGSNDLQKYNENFDRKHKMNCPKFYDNNGFTSNFETSFESDSDSCQYKYHHRKTQAQVTKSFTIYRNQKSDGITFEENDDFDFIEIDYDEEEKIECDCYFFDNLKTKTYFSSDDESI